MEGVCESCRSVEGSSCELMLGNALQSGHEKCLKTLIGAGTDVNWINKDTKNTALTHAAREGHEDCLQLLVNAGADVNLAVEKFSDDEGEEEADRPLMLAADNGHVNCVQILIESGADVNAKTKSSYTAVHGAVLCGNQACLELLVKAGADVNMCHFDENPRGEGTPLEMICHKGKHPHLVKPLVNAGANIEPKLPHEKPLFIAACAGHYMFIDELIKAGASVNIDGFDQMTPLMYVALSKENESKQTETVNYRKCLDLLLKAGANVNTTGRLWSSALLYAAKTDNCYAIERLLQAGANVNMRSDHKGETALMWVAGKGCRDCALALIDVGADVNMVSEDGNTALFYAYNVKCIQALLCSGAKINMWNKNGHNALQNWIKEKWYIRQKKVSKCLFAAGETPPDNTTLRGILFTAKMEESVIILKQMCREAVRKHLLELDPRAHLFDQVPTLGLPELLSAYLLYNISLDDDEEDEEEDDSRTDDENSPPSSSSDDDADDSDNDDDNADNQIFSDLD